MNCIKIGLPEKLILSKRKGLPEDLFSLENSLRESIFREDLFLCNCLQGDVFKITLETDEDMVSGRGAF